MTLEEFEMKNQTQVIADTLKTVKELDVLLVKHDELTKSINTKNTDLEELTMNKVINKEFNDYDYSYDFALENGDTVNVTEDNYNKIMNHVSIQGVEYKAIVNEHENDFEEPIEYIGFVAVK